MQNPNKSETATADQTRGDFYKKIIKDVVLQIGLVVFLWFVFYAALHG